MFASRLNIARVGIDPAKLTASAQALLQSARSTTDLAVALNWQSHAEREFLDKAFLPHTDTETFDTLLSQTKRRTQLREKRLRRGYADFTTPRRGLKGWWQKQQDNKELALPLATDVLEWLNQSHRLSLITAMHDSLLHHCMQGVPAPVRYEDIPSPAHPLTALILESKPTALKLLHQALTKPLHQIPVDFLIHHVCGYVLYRPQLGFGYYFQAT